MTLTDRHGTVIQRQRTSGTTTTAYDRYGNMLGRYEAGSNRTYDRYGTIIGSGNLLAFLS